MNIEDAVESLSEAEAKAVLIFFFAERERHREDIKHIEKLIKLVKTYHKITPQELEKAYQQGLGFVDIDDGIKKL